MKRKAKFRSAPIVPNIEEDVEIGEEDLELMNEYGTMSSFLMSLDPKALTRKTKAAPAGYIKKSAQEMFDEQDMEDIVIETGAVMQSPIKKRKIKNEEEDYEKAPRPRFDQPAAVVNSRLPILGENGKMVENETPLVYEPVEEISEEVYESEEEKMNESEQEDSPTSTLLEKSPTKMSFLQAKEHIAHLALSITENPEGRMSLLKRLREFVKHKDDRIKGTAFLAQLAVFKDIIPGYRIRLTTEKEKEAKVTKEVRKLRQFEEGLLSNYQGFLRELENTVKNIRSKPRPLPEHDSLLLVRAVKCFTELLTCASHFNFKLNIMTEVIGLSAMKDPETISQMCYEAMVTLFKEDEQGESALEAVKLISKFIQTRHYKGCESILRTFAHLRLANELCRKHIEEKKEKIKKKDREHFSKRQKKQMKVDAEIQKELKEAEAVVDLQERQKIHTETLKHVMVLYFKILKDDHAHHLLPAVLEGLSKFGHLVNVDFFADILKCLRQISQNIQKQYTECQPGAHDPRTALHCIVAAFQLLSGQGEALEIDLKDFVAIIYQLLHRLPCQTHYCLSTSHFETTPFEDALKVIDLAFIQRKQLSVERSAAFLKRLATIALHIPTPATMSILSVMHAMIIKYPKLQGILDVEDRVGNGKYLPMIEDPDAACPLSTTLWELSLLQTHFNPDVRRFATTVSQMRKTGNTYQPLPPDLAKKTLFNRYSEALTHSKFIPETNLIAPERITIKKALDGYSVTPSAFMKQLETLY